MKESGIITVAHCTNSRVLNSFRSFRSDQSTHMSDALSDVQPKKSGQQITGQLKTKVIRLICLEPLGFHDWSLPCYCQSTSLHPTRYLNSLKE